MPPTLFLLFKSPFFRRRPREGSQQFSTVNANSERENPLLHVRDSISGQIFLVDTGASVSVLPTSSNVFKNKPGPNLYATNGSKIVMFGTRYLRIEFSDRHKYGFRFYIADTHIAILGADFIERFSLVVDLRNNCLIDTVSGGFIPGWKCNPVVCGLNFIAPDHNTPYVDLLSSFNDITIPRNAAVRANHGTEHRIITNGCPTRSRCRPLPPHLKQKVKNRLQEMLKSGVIIRSKSPFASPITVVPKGLDDIRICVDYRKLNNQTVKDRWPVPFLRDFTNELSNCNVFSKVDLAKAYTIKFLFIRTIKRRLLLFVPKDYFNQRR